MLDRIAEKKLAILAQTGGNLMLTELKIIGFGMALAVGLVSVAAAQNCDAILQGGVFDKRKVFESSDHFYQFQSFICTSKFGSYQQAQNAANSLNIGYGGFNLDFGGTTASANYSVWEQKFCASKFFEIKTTDTVLYDIQTASTAISDAWSKCIGLYSKGLLAYLVPGYKKENFDIEVIYKPSGAPFETIVSSFDLSPDGTSCASPLAPLDKIGPNGRVMLCTRPDAKVEARAAINTSQGSLSLRLRPYEPPPIVAPQKWRESVDIASSKCNLSATYYPSYVGPNTWTMSGTKLIGTSSTQAVVESYLICTYTLPRPMNEFVISFGGAKIDFSTNDGSGGGLGLLAFRGKPDTASMAQWGGHGSPAWQQWWTNTKGVSHIDAPAKDFSVSFGSTVTEVTVGLVMVDAWKDTTVTINVDGVSMSEGDTAPDAHNLKILHKLTLE